MRLWIRDEDHTPQRFPLQKLLREVIRAAGAQSVVIHVRRVDGQGERVKQLADKLDTMETVAIPLSELDALAKGTDEWFFDILVALPGSPVRFGIHDSTAMFVDGENALLDAVAAAFTHCEWDRADER